MSTTDTSSSLKSASPAIYTDTRLEELPKVLSKAYKNRNYGKTPGWSTVLFAHPETGLIGNIHYTDGSSKTPEADDPEPRAYLFTGCSVPKTGFHTQHFTVVDPLEFTADGSLTDKSSQNLSTSLRDHFSDMGPSKSSPSPRDTVVWATETIWEWIKSDQGTKQETESATESNTSKTPSDVAAVIQALAEPEHITLISKGLGENYVHPEKTLHQYYEDIKNEAETAHKEEGGSPARDAN